MKLRLKIARFFAYVVAIQLLNLSVYTGEFYGLNVAKTTSTSVDEIDSFVELIAENVMHTKNVDTDSQSTNENKETHLYKNFQVKLFTEDITMFKVQCPERLITPKYATEDDYYFLFCKEINPPPPKSLV